MAVPQAVLDYGGGGQGVKQQPGTLYEGSQGEGVRALQQRLTDLGYDVGGVDAIFGPKTAGALTKFQQDAGIDVDAIAGPQTWGALAGAGYGGTAPVDDSLAYTTPRRVTGRLGDVAEDFGRRVTPVDAATRAGTSPFSRAPGAESFADQAARLRDAGTRPAVTSQAPVTQDGGAAAPGQAGGTKPGTTTEAQGGGSKQDQGAGSKPAAGSSGQGAGGTTTTVTPGQASGLQGYTALKLSDLTGAFGQFAAMNKEAMAPYETSLRELLNRQPGYTAMTDEQILARAREQAALAVGGQRTSITQSLEQQRQQAALRQQAVEAGYAGSQEAVNQALAEARRQATESAIARGGGRSGQVDWFTEKLQQPLMSGFQQQQAQRAASIAEIQQGLGLTEQQAAQRLEQLGQQEGALTAQQAAALRDAEYGRAMQSWQAGLTGTMGLAELAGQQNQFNAQQAMSLMPYLYGTWGERNQLPFNWAQLIGQVPPGTGPQPLTGLAGQTGSGAGAQPVPVRTYAASKGKGASVSWDEATDTVRVGNMRLTHEDLVALGGREENGVAYLPQEVLDRLLGLGAV